MSDLREGGDLSRKIQAPRRAWLVVNLVVTAVLLPALFMARGDTGPDHQAVRAGTFDTVAVSATAGAGATAQGADVEAILDELAPVPTTAPPTTAPPPTTTTTARPRPRPRPRPTTTAAPPAVRPAQAEPAPTTTTTRPPSTTTSAKPGDPPARTESGKATWYHQRSGICAHKTLPFGTKVTVTNTRNGRTTQCTVGDRGPFVEGYIIDLAPEQFDQVSSRSAGVFPTKITW